jgi:hypothetical protein
MRELGSLIAFACLAVGLARGQEQPQEPEAVPVEAPRPVANVDRGADAGIGLGGPGFGAPGYKATWYPTRPVVGSPAEFGLVRQSLSGAAPIWRQGPDTLLLTAGVRHTLFSTDAVLPDTQRPFPGELWNVSAGLMHIHRFENGWTGGLSATVGSASDKPFQGIEEMNANLFGFLKVPAANDRDSWLFSVMYSPVGNLTFPLPGLAYMWKPNDRLQAVIGIPFSLKWNPVDDLTLTFSYIPVTNINARAGWRLREGLEAYAGFEWLNEAYFLSDRASRQDRFLAFEKRLIGGLRCDIRKHVALDLNAGYAFDRFYGEGRNQFSNLRDQIEIAPGAFLGASLLVRW